MFVFLLFICSVSENDTTNMKYFERLIRSLLSFFVGLPVVTFDNFIPERIVKN